VGSVSPTQSTVAGPDSGKTPGAPIITVNGEARHPERAAAITRGISISSISPRKIRVK